MSVELILGIVVLVVVVGAILYTKKNPGVLQADLDKLEASIKAHVTSAVASQPPADHVAVIQAVGAATVQAIQAAKPTVGGVPADQAALWLGQGTVNAALAPAAPVAAPVAPLAAPAKAPPFPGVWIEDAAKGQTITSESFTLPGGFEYELWTEQPCYFKDFSLSGIGSISVNVPVVVKADTSCTLSATCYGNPDNPTGAARLQCKLDKKPIKP